jgi:channel protein (hemolysin III family)
MQLRSGSTPMKEPKKGDSSSNGRGGNKESWNLRGWAVQRYVENCKECGVAPDMSVLVTLSTGWHVLKPSKNFCEGSMLPLMGVLDENEHVEKFVMNGAGMYSARKPAAGNGNSNARVLGKILQMNRVMKCLDVSNTGLDDDGVTELSAALADNSTLTELDLSQNHFSCAGAEALEKALQKNNALARLDVSCNGLGYKPISQLQATCKARQRRCACHLEVHGNYVFEEILNSLTHAVGFLATIIGSCLLISEASGPDKSGYHFWGCTLFCWSLMVLYLSSTLFHSFFMIPQMHFILQIADHCAIYLLIAGSYTPFVLISLHHSSSAQIILVLEWIGAIGGCMFSVCADLYSTQTMYVELTLYMAMGLAILLVFNEVQESMDPDALKLLIAGGVSYVLGVPFFVKGQTVAIYHVFWHIMVMVASALHFMAVYLYVVHETLPASNAGGSSSSWATGEL